MDIAGLDLYHTIRPFFQPAIGAFHGWFATRMVVVMLFKPHKTYYFPFTKKRIPFTPGIFPSRKSALAQNIAKTVTETLLTPKDIEAKTEKFITEDNIFLIIDVTADTMVDGFKYTDKIQKLANQFKEGVPDLINTTVNTLIDKLINNQGKQLTRLIDYLVHDILLGIKINKKTATELVNYTFEHFFSPKNIRITLISSLTPERASNLHSLIIDKTTGPLKFVLSFVNLESVFNNFKDYLKNEPEKSEALILEFTKQLKIKEDLVEKISSVDFRKLSYEHISAIKENLNVGITEYLSNNRDNIHEFLSPIQSSISEIINQKILEFSPSNVKPEIILMIKKEITRFLYNYLKADLTGLIDKGIKAIKPREMISSKIEAYSSQDVEELILGIMRRELANLEYLGLLIGVFLGMSALAIEYFLPYK